MTTYDQKRELMKSFAELYDKTFLEKKHLSESEDISESSRNNFISDDFSLIKPVLISHEDFIERIKEFRFLVKRSDVKLIAEKLSVSEGVVYQVLNGRGKSERIRTYTWAFILNRLTDLEKIVKLPSR